jgi:hypothetical protein
MELGGVFRDDERGGITGASGRDGVDEGEKNDVSRPMEAGSMLTVRVSVDIGDVNVDLNTGGSLLSECLIGTDSLLDRDIGVGLLGVEGS